MQATRSYQPTLLFSSASLWMALIMIPLQVVAASRPNVLFIAIDDLKPMLGCYGDSQIKTPEIDRLAARGTVFLNNHCQQAVCGPSRASLLTGLRPDTTGVWDLKTRMREVNPDILTLPQFFKQQGYETVGLGKIFDTRCVEGRQFCDQPSWSRPFVHTAVNPDSEYGYLNAEFVKRARKIKKELKARGITEWNAQRKALGGVPTTEGSEPVADNAYEDGVIADTAVNLLQELSAGDKPFFLAVGFKKPHLPFVAPRPYWDLYDRDDFKVDPVTGASKGAPAYAYQNSWELRNGTYTEIPSQGPIEEAKQREMIHGYHACVSYIDAQVGKLLTALEESGESANTVIVLWGDHGFHLGDHGMWCKHTNYEQATRSPLIFAAPPGRVASGATDAPTEFVDIFPTLCALTGLPSPAGLHGTSLLPLMKNPAGAVKPAAISQYPRQLSGKPLMGYAYRTRQYRYIEWVQKNYRKGGTSGPVIAIELYDYSKDPAEKQNLADDPAYAETLEQLKTTAAGLKP